MALPNHDQHLSTNSQFIRCQYESYVIVHHCLVYSIVFLCERLYSPNRNSSHQGKGRQPRESSEHCLTGPSWTRWMHSSLPTASLVAPATEYRRRLVRSSGVAWMWVAQESCGNRIKQSQNQENLDIV